MPWSRSRPRGGKVNPKYRTPEHLAQCAAYKAQLERDGYLTCAEPLCLYRTRTILPGMAWAAGHDPSGTRYIGPVHRRCNAREASVRARQRQTVTAQRM
jgi:hypothetical protein